MDFLAKQAFKNATGGAFSSKGGGKKKVREGWTSASKTTDLRPTRAAQAHANSPKFRTTRA
jgi:hypothetical protein